MAAYRADIEIGVRGQRALEQLRSSINQTATAVDSLNDVMGARGALSQSVQNYTNNLNRAAASLRNVGAGIPAETRAVREYVRALGEANAARARQNYLVAQEMASQRQIRPGTAAYGQQTPALPPALIKGQQVTQAWNKFFIDAERAVKDLQNTSAAKNLNVKTSWQKFFTEASNSATELQTKAKIDALNLKTSWAKFFIEAQNVAKDLAAEAQRTAAAIRTKEGAASTAARQRLAEEAATRQRIRDAGFGLQGPQLPPQQTAAQQIKANDAQKRLNNLLTSAQILEQKIAQNRAKGINVVEQQAQIQRVLNSLQQEGVNTTTQYLTAVDKVLNSLRNELRLQKAILDTQKSQTTQTTKKASKSRTADIAGNAIIGGAFPLLFGQGLGASIGGGAGGAIGGAMGGNFGFGLSLVGTAAGSAFDQAIQSAQDFSKSLRQGGDAAGYLEQRLGILDPTIKKQIQNLQQSGQTAKAAQLAFSTLAESIGTENAQAFKDLGDETLKFSVGFQRLVTLLVAGAARISDKVGPVLSSLVPVVGGLSAITKLVISAAPALPKESAQTSEAVQRTQALGREESILRTQLQLTTVSAKTDLDRYTTLSKTVAQKEYENELTQLAIQLKNGEISAEQRKQSIVNAGLQLAIKLGEIERQRVQEIQRRQEEAARAAKQAAEEAARAAERALGLEIELLQTTLKVGDIDVQRVKITKGERAAIQEELSQLQTRLELEARALDIKYQQQMLTKNITAQERTLLQSVYEQQRGILEAEAQIRQQILVQARAKLDVDKQLADMQAVQQAIQPFEDVRAQRELDLQYSKTYLRLVTEGLLPAEAARVAGYDKIIAQQIKQLDLQIAIAESELLTAQNLKLVGDEMQKYVDNVERLKKARGAAVSSAEQGAGRSATPTERLQDAIATARGELNELIDPINQVIAGAAAIGDSFQQAFKGLVSGAMTGQQALAAFFKGVGDHFLDMASKMIAKLIEIWILETVLGFISGAAAGGGQGGGVNGVQTNAPGVSGLATTSMAMAANGAYWPGGFQAFADGGVVTRPTMGLIGEGGEPEYVIPASKMRSAMGRYAAGARGSSVIPSSGGDSAMEAGGIAASAPIDVRYTVERINNVDYVTADQFQAGLQQAAAQGARRGEQRTLATLRQNTAQRKRVGI